MSCLSRLFANFDTLRFFNIRFSRYKFQVITTCQPFRMPIHNRFAIISSRASHYPLLFSLAHTSKLASLRETFACIAHGFVEIKGFEPLTPCLQGRCSPNWAIPPWIRQPPALPYRLQHSTIGRLGLNHRVRDGNGCYPWPHQHQVKLTF